MTREFRKTTRSTAERAKVKAARERFQTPDPRT